MFAIGKGSGGATVTGTGGRVFPLAKNGEAIRAEVQIEVLSDKITSRNVWMPYEGCVEVKVDSGADTSCISATMMLLLGVKEDSTDIRTVVRVANGEIIVARKKFVAIKFSGFPEPVMVTVNYSSQFRDDLFVLSLSAVVTYFGVAFDFDSCVLFGT